MIAPGVRRQMEAALGADFRQVRVHDDPAVHRLSEDMGARAFTVGRDIFLGANMRRGASPHARRHLLAHELVHVLQQEPSRGAAGGISHPGQASERQAEAVAQQALIEGDNGRPVTPAPEPRTGPTLMRVPVSVQRDQYDHFGRDTRSRFERTRDACNNRLNWSDGGHWIGSGPEPDCFGERSRESITTRMGRIRWEWPTEESVIRSRELVNRSRNMIGYIAGGLVGIGTAGIGTVVTAKSAAVSVLAGVGTSVLTDYIPSFIDLVRTGDRLTITTKVTGERSAHPWGRSEIRLQATWELVDRNGAFKWGTSYGETIDAGDIGRRDFDRLFTLMKRGP